MRVLWTHNYDFGIEAAGRFLPSDVTAMKAIGIEVDLFYTGSLRDPRAIVRARERLRRIAGGYDIVHSQYGSACAALTAAVDRPLVLTLRGSDWHRYRGSSVALRMHSRVATMLTRLALPHYRAIISVSGRIRTEVEAFGFRGSVTVIPTAVDCTQFMPQDRRTARLKMFGDAQDGPRVLFTTLSSSNPIKRAALAAAVMERVKRVRPDASLATATGVPHAQMPTFVSACDVVLCTSVYEGWPNSVKEGLACGLPFVATDVSDLREVASRYPPCAVVDDDPDRLAQAVLAALEVGGGPHLRGAVADMSHAASAGVLANVYRGMLA